MLTPLSPWKIAFGKWKAAVGQVFAILLLAAPVAAICVYLGGVGPSSLLWGTALPLVSAGFGAAVALFCSTVFRTPALATVAAVLALIAGIIGPIWIVASGGGGSDIESLAFVHPVVAAVVVAEDVRFRSRFDVDIAWVLASCVSTFLSIAVVFFASLRLEGRIDVAAGPTLFARVMKRMDGFFENLNAGGKAWLTGGEVWQERGLLWKELRLRAAGRLRYATRVGLALVLGLIVLSSMAGDLSDGFAVFAWGLSILLALQALVTGVGSFIAEKEGRQWDILLCTPLTTDAILGAKLVSGLAALGPGAVVVVLFSAAMGLAGVEPVFLAGSLLLPVGLFVVYIYLSATAASLRCATYRGAFALAAGLVLAPLVGLPLLVVALDSMSHMSFDEDWWMAASNPVYHLEAFGSAISRGWATYSYYRYNRLEGSTISYAALYGIASLLLWGWMRVDIRRVGRAT
jgi:ABC-type transport system involved in multi-copper enzyme maturation permease subunit